MPIPHGKQKELAHLAHISPQLLCDIMKGYRQCKPKVAEALVAATKKLLKVDTDVFDWMNPRETSNELFR